MSTVVDASWRLGYRPALDGLRAIAVLLVIGAHAALVRNAGGVGVLIFFVLSGFLITSLLLREHDESNHVDLIAFYRRRAARLLPALFAMSLVVAVYLLVTGKPERVLPDAGGAVSYVGNWLQIAGVKMVLTSHTWSLAVEEQFYIIWPALFLLILRFPRVAWVVAGLLIVSELWRFTLSDVLGATSPRTTRGLDAAAPALLAGCALAFAVRARPNLSAGRVGYLLGAGLITGAVVVLALGGGSDWILEATVAGTVLLIAAVHSTQTGLLTIAPLRYVGRISYGLYLWHFPVFAILAVSRPIEIGATFAIAMVSYHAFEAPILRRYGRSRSKAPAAAPAAAPAEVASVPGA